MKCLIKFSNRDGVMLGNFNRMERKECIGNDCIEPQVIPIEEVFVHDGFTKYAREHDVALIKLAHEVKFSSKHFN